MLNIITQALGPIYSQYNGSRIKASTPKMIQLRMRMFKRSYLCCARAQWGSTFLFLYFFVTPDIPQPRKSKQDVDAGNGCIGNTRHSSCCLWKFILWSCARSYARGSVYFKRDPKKPEHSTKGLLKRSPKCLFSRSNFRAYAIWAAMVDQVQE